MQERSVFDGSNEGALLAEENVGWLVAIKGEEKEPMASSATSGKNTHTLLLA